MTLWNRLQRLSPAWRRREESEMREEMEALTALAGPRELGNLTLAMEDARAAWGWGWLDSLARDLRYAVRTLRREPAFVAVAVLSLALAIGANSAIFSFADALLLRPLPVTDPSGLLDVTNATPDSPLEGMSFPDYRDFRDGSRSFASLAAYRFTTLAAAESPTAPARIRLAMLVSDNVFPAAGVAPVAGRSFLPGEADRPGHAVAMISYGLWRQEYSGSPAAVGAGLRLNGIVFTIIGITPKSFTALERLALPTLFVPLGMAQRLEAGAADPLEDRARHDLVVKGRLASGVSLEAARAELAALGAALERQYPRTNRRRLPVIRTELARRILQRPQMLSLIRMLMGLVGLILLIAGSNLASLLLARARARNREIAIRLSIGAGRARLVRQLMTESLLIALLGGASGLVVAYGGILLLQTLSVPSDPPSYLGVQLDWRVVWFSILAALATWLAFGLVPAWQTVRLNFLSALKSGGGRAAGSQRTIGRDILVAGQIALAMVVLIAAGMFLAGFRKMLVTRPDFRVDRVISMDTGPALIHYTPEQMRVFYRQLVDRARTLAGVEAVAMTESLPLSTSQTVLTVVPEGHQFPNGRESTVVFGAAVDAAYFQTLRVEIVRGRAFNDDDRAGSRRVAIVNQEFASRYWPGLDPIGRRVRLDRPDGIAAEVVGVAKTGHYLTVYEVPAPYVYLPYEQNPRQRMTLIVQSEGDAGALAAPLRETVRSLDPNLPVFNLRTVATLYQSRATDTSLQFFTMVGTMGFIGMILATIGLYGLVAFTVNSRVQEFGIRVALGATRRDVLWLVERRGLLLAGIGIAIGGLLAGAATPLLAAGFPGLTPSSPALYTAVALALLAVSLSAGYLPARRAAGLDPLRSLRNE